MGVFFSLSLSSLQWKTAKAAGEFFLAADVSRRLGLDWLEERGGLVIARERRMGLQVYELELFKNNKFTQLGLLFPAS